MLLWFLIFTHEILHGFSTTLTVWADIMDKINFFHKFLLGTKLWTRYACATTYPDETRCHQVHLWISMQSWFFLSNMTTRNQRICLFKSIMSFSYASHFLTSEHIMLKIAQVIVNRLYLYLINTNKPSFLWFNYEWDLIQEKLQGGQKPMLVENQCTASTC